MKNVEEIKNDLRNINDISNIKDNPAVQSVLLSPLKSIPIIGDFIDSATENLLNDFQKRKEHELINVILSESNCIVSEMVNDVEFIINFNKTLEAVRRLATNDKVKFFGNLVRNGYLKDKRIENSIFEEYLDILNSLSYREIKYLIDFKKWLDKRSDLPVSINDWSHFKEEYSKENGIYCTELENIFVGLTRTGFIKVTYREDEKIVCLCDDKKARKKLEKKENKRAISNVYDIYLTLHFGKFYKMVLKEGEL